MNSPNNGHFGARPIYCPLFGVRPLLGNYCWSRIWNGSSLPI